MMFILSWYTVYIIIYFLKKHFKTYMMVFQEWIFTIILTSKYEFLKSISQQVSWHLNMLISEQPFCSLSWNIPAPHSLKYLEMHI